jgi:hypothetical protein
MLPQHTPTLFGGRDAYTKLLLHFDNNYTDSSPTAKGNGTMFGAGTFNSSIFKFGTHSFANGQNAYITFPNHADWGFGAGDFTIDMWYYTTNAGAMLSRDLPSTFVPFLLYNPGGGPLFYSSSNGSAWDLANAVSMGPNTGGRFMHLAVTRQGNNWRTFQDGVVYGSWSASGAVMANSNPLCIGAYANANNAGGYTDELRISKGIARWTGTFTPPTVPYT